jgi:hypothetical protein
MREVTGDFLFLFPTLASACPPTARSSLDGNQGRARRKTLLLAAWTTSRNSVSSEGLGRFPPYTHAHLSPEGSHASNKTHPQELVCQGSSNSRTSNHTHYMPLTIFFRRHDRSIKRISWASMDRRPLHCLTPRQPA